MERLRIAIFASGSGSNFQAIVDAVNAGKLNADIKLLVCDKPQAGVVSRAQAEGVEAFTFTPKTYASREEYEAEILGLLEEKQIDLIVLAGYMRLITDTLVKPYYGRMINIHPSLLPSFTGINAVGQAMEYGVKLTGVTVHYVDGGLDSGPIIAQREVRILENDTEDELSSRIHKIEHELYTEVIGWISEGRVKLDGRKVNVLNVQ